MTENDSNYLGNNQNTTRKTLLRAQSNPLSPNARPQPQYREIMKLLKIRPRLLLIKEYNFTEWVILSSKSQYHISKHCILWHISVNTPKTTYSLRTKTPTNAWDEITSLLNPISSPIYPIKTNPTQLCESLKIHKFWCTIIQIIWL